MRRRRDALAACPTSPRRRKTWARRRLPRGAPAWQGARAEVRACNSGERDTETATGGDDSGGAASLVDRVAGYCEYVGCDADADCSGDSACRAIDGVSVCLVDCSGDADCAMIYAMKWAADDRGDNYCDCDPGPGGRAEDRDREGNGGICESQTGECHCRDDARCEAARVCI